MKVRPKAAVKIALMVSATLLATMAKAGDIKGRASDTGGGALPGAEVALENVATGVETASIADSSGGYSFTGLKAGLYRLSARLPGFSQVARNISLASDQTNAEVSNSQQLALFAYPDDAAERGET